jgi:hypothetical protein
MTHEADGARKPERIEVLPPTLPRGALWQPVVGEETQDLLLHLGLPEESRQTVQAEAVSILSRAPSPTQLREPSTGLIMGYVQSGKTLSFTAVTALARDNGFQLVVLITGTSTPLYDQSKNRLLRDLRIGTREDRKWHPVENPSIQLGSDRAIEGTLADWRDEHVPDPQRQTVLITVMKNHKLLRNLTQVLQHLDLRGVPGLIIDDEADQAGLNTRVRQGQQSTTYRRLLDLRGCLPSHVYLQYTATPQAPLLINIIDVLSPRFPEVLTPGGDYVGGKAFFVEHADLVRAIPASEVPTAANPLHEPPASLLEAMRIFSLGVAAGLRLDGGRGNRSMLVHPSRETQGHADYHRWASQIKASWERLLRLGANDPDRQELLRDFQANYEDLRATVVNLPSFPELAEYLERAIRKTRLMEINAARGQTPSPDWRSSYAHLLVGGQAMDRGFTVEGLTVTYMPRGIGVGNADTLQQRARFLGYKQGYIGYCRVYLESGALNAYREYVGHEEDLRARLADFSATGRPLAEWRRAFFLDGALEPTRRNVLDVDYMRGRFSDDWYTPSTPHDSPEAIATNRSVVTQFLARLPLKPDQGHPDRTPVQHHLVTTNVSLELAYRDLLTCLRLTRPEDSQELTGVLLQIKAYLEGNPEATCTVYQISPGEHRERGVDDEDRILNLFQGAYPVNPEAERGSIYPGDRAIKGKTGLTLQFHSLTIKRSGGERTLDVPTVAVWIPREMSRQWLVQEGPGN